MRRSAFTTGTRRIRITCLAVAVTTLTAGSALAHGGFGVDEDAGAEALLAFQGRAGGDYEVYVSRPGTGRVRRLTRNAVDDRRPDWSPDGRRLIFIRGNSEGVGSYHVITADGRRTWRLGRAVSPYEWSPDGRWIAFTERNRPGLSLVKADGSQRRSIYSDEPSGFEWSPDSSRLTFGCAHDICSVRPSGGAATRLIRNGTYPDWSPDGRRVAFLRPIRRGQEQIAFVARGNGTGVKRLLPTAVSEYERRPWSWSPDGRRLAVDDSYDDGDGDTDRVHRLGLVSADGSGFEWIYQREGGLSMDHSWSPAGREIAFECGRDHDFRDDICLADVGTRAIRNLTETEDRSEWLAGWSPNGNMLAYTTHAFPGGDHSFDGIYALDVRSEASVRLTELGGDPSWSPDGRWISFWANSLAPDLYIVRPDGTNLTRIARLALRDVWQPVLRR